MELGGPAPQTRESGTQEDLQGNQGGEKLSFSLPRQSIPWGGELKARQEGESAQKICDSAAIRQPGQRWSQVEEGADNERARACLIINS